jgi:hypothetical protein
MPLQGKIGWRTLTASTSAQIVTNGLLLHLDAGNSASYSGSGTTWTNLVSGNNGTLTNGVGYNSANGGALTFDGVNDYIDCSSVNTGNVFTVQVWAKISRFGGNPGNNAWNRGTLVANSYNWGGNTGFFFHVTSQDPNIGNTPVAGKENFSFSIGQDYYGAAASTGSLANYVNRWVNLSVVVNGTTPIKLFINGIEISDYAWRTNGAPSINYNAPCIIGARLQENTDYTQGSIGSVNIYNRALTSAEILQNYNATKTRFGYSTVTPLLDNISGSNAAFSLRRLRTAYTGSAIRVRRSSDNTEQNIGFDSSGSLDISALLQFVGTGSGFVTIWYDQSGNTNNIRQTVAANQPRIVTSGNILLDNGRPTIKFGTSNDSWPPNETSTFLTLPATFLANTPTPIHMFNVWKITDWTNSNGGIFGSTNSFGNGLEIAQTSVISRRSLLRINNSIKNDNQSETYQLWNNAQQSLTTINILPNSVSAFKNGNGILLTNTTGMQNLNNNNDSYSIGLYAGTYPGYMNQQELIFFTTDKTSERTTIESNINSHYSIF